MPINIQEQFQVNIGLPIDSRIVASGSSARSSIPYKYDGLIVYDTAERKTYAWNANISDWQLTDISGAGSQGRITLWSSVSGLTSSGAFWRNVGSGGYGKFGINVTSAGSINEVLQINSISPGTSQPFVIHKGSVNNIIGSNWYNNGLDSYNSVSDGSGIIKFRSSGEITFANRASLNSTALDSSDTFNSFLAASFKTNENIFYRNTYFTNSGSIISAAYIRALSAFSTQTNPDFTWWGDDMTGIFHPADNKIGVSIEGVQKLILTANGLAISASNNVTSPSSRLHLDGGNSSSAYIQFTAGTTTGVGSNNGVLMGINSAGYPTFQSRLTNFPFLFVYSSGNSHHALQRNKIVTYSNSNGENFASVSAALGGNGSRTERISRQTLNSGGSFTSFLLYSLDVPSSCYVSIEVTYVTSLDPASGSSQFRTCKILQSFTCNSGGTVTAQGSATTIANVSGSAASGIGVGTLSTGALNTIQFYQQMGVSGSWNSYTILEIVAVFNKNIGS